MYLVDSHCHIDQIDLPDVLLQAKNAEVHHMLCVCITLTDFPKMFDLVAPHAHISTSVGLHPNETTDKEPTAQELIALAQHEKIVAIGETGLDYYRTTGDVEFQQERFRQHIMAAKAVKKPLIVHTRQARADTIAILRAENASEVSGVMHCFTEDWDTAKAALDLGFYISFSGIVTFKNATEIQAVAKQVPLDRILIETDSPYLAPNPHRGKTNQPAYVRFVAEYIAELRGMTLEKMAEHTTNNFFNLFKGAKR